MGYLRLKKISREGLGIRQYITSHMRIAMYAVVLVVLLAAVGGWVFRGLRFDENLHTVIPNEVYRSAQPSSVELKRWIEELSLRSVINLRGERVSSWFKKEQAVTEAHGVDLYSIALGNGAMPPLKALRQLINLLDTAKRPVLLHCAHGIERSGIASAVAVLLAGGDVVETREQFGLTYGFIPRVDEHPKMLDDYEQWLAMRGWSSTPDRFRRWVENDYVPFFYRARLEPLEVPTSIGNGSVAMLRFRATNTSPQPWRLRSKQDRGIHLGAKVRLLEPGGEHEIELRGGFRDLTVAPGEAVVLGLPVPPLPKTGRYQFFVDLFDEEGGWFSSMGSEPLIFELRVVASEKSWEAVPIFYFTLSTPLAHNFGILALTQLLKELTILSTVPLGKPAEACK
jgi:protein tyrosine phosphatase (PTP) superfamily phosphohydrolase (DUF442 family)